MSDQNTVEYGSDEYYEETGKNGLTINTKNTENLPAYDKKLFYVDSFFKKMVYSNNSRGLTTYSNFYYKGSDNKLYYWHRKRKSKYAVMPGGSIVYIDAEASMERFTGYSTYYSVVEPWKRAPVFHGMLDGKAYFTVVGSSKFDDEDNVYIARSDDGLLIEPILKIPRNFDGENIYYWSSRFDSCFRPNYKGKLGHFTIEYWRKDDDPNPDYNMRHKIHCSTYDGLNYRTNVVAVDMYGDGDIEEVYNNWQAKGELYNVSNSYPIFVYYYSIDKYSVGDSGRYDPTRNTHNFADMYSSQYILYIEYYWYKVYNANTNQTTDLPFVTFLDEINSWWWIDSRYQSRIINPKDIPITVLRCWGIMPVFNNICRCPNGNILVSIFYRCDPRVPEYVGQMYPEYAGFSRFFVTPIYFVIDGSTGEWIKSNIQEPIDYDASNAQVSDVSIPDNARPVGVYTDSEYAWFRKPYREETDITFYGTRDGYNIDKRITYYNRTTLPEVYHMMIKNSVTDQEYILTYNTSKGDITRSQKHFEAVPVFENGVFQKFMVAAAANGVLSYYSSRPFGLAEDVTPDADGQLHLRLTYTPVNNQQYDQYRVRYTRKQPGQSDDNYVYNIE